MIEEIYSNNLNGMTCLSCVDTIMDHMFSLRGIIDVKVSYFKSSFEIKYDPNIITKEEIEKALKDIGYSVSDKKENNLFNELLTCFLIILFLIILKYINLPMVPSLNNGASLLFLFIVGLLTGTHCICMCSGIMLMAINNDDKYSLFKYQLGRLIMSTTIGFLFGLIGNVFVYSLKLKSMIYTLCGLLILFFGLCKWGIIPVFRKLETNVFKLCFKAKHLKINKAIIIGMLNALLPCGMSSTMWIYSASLANPLLSALTMFVWCLGTVVFMSLFSLTNKFLSSKNNIIFQRFSTIIMVTMGIRMLIKGITL